MQRRQALWQTGDYFLNEKFYLKTLNPKETKWKHLLYISSRFFIDESSCNPCSLRANMSLLLRSGLYFRRHIYLIALYKYMRYVILLSLEGSHIV